MDDYPKYLKNTVGTLDSGQHDCSIFKSKEVVYQMHSVFVEETEAIQTICLKNVELIVEMSAVLG